MDADEGRRHDVVVGVDGSELALHAVGWAATEAQLRGLPLRVVHARPADPGATGPRSAPQILARAFTVAHRAAPDVVVSTSTSTQDPAAALLDAAAGATVLVVGMGGGGDTPGGPLVGSVALEVSGRAPCPVVVVRGGPVPPRGPVLVGVDASGEDGLRRDDAALRAAFADARRHGGRVAVLHARYVTGPQRTPAQEQAADVAARDRLRAALGAWTARFPEVPVEVGVVHGNPARALLEAAEGSRLVVLGTRGQGAYARDLFGSTSREVLRRSPVTVLVVDPDSATTAPDAPPPTSADAQLDHPHDHSMLF